MQLETEQNDTLRSICESATKPILFNFESCTCPKFMLSLERFNEFYEKYKSKFMFVVKKQIRFNTK